MNSQHSGHRRHEGNDHTHHHEHMIRDFKQRFWISLALTLPILLLSPMIQDILGYELQFGFSRYILFVFSALVYFYGGWPFLSGLTRELKQKNPGMMTLIAVAITVAFGYSSATTFGLEGKTFFWELATLVDIMLLGHWIEMKSVARASGSLQKLAEMMPTEAHRLQNGDTEEVSVEDLDTGDRIRVHPGEKIPADGKIRDGKSRVNESMVTGESRPVLKQPGDSVIGGTINGNGSLTVEVEQAGDQAYLHKVIGMVREAQAEKSKTQHLADRIAFWLTLVSLTVGFGSLTVWLLLQKPFVFALERMASVMVITCPHALGLAVPLVVAISTTLAARRGLLIRNRTAFENARKITLLAFDKTGTLTRGNFTVARFLSFDRDRDAKEVLQLAAALESRSEHPLAEGIGEKAEELGLERPEVTDFNAITGKGIEGKIGGKRIKVVSPGYLKEKRIELPEGAGGEEDETVVYLLIDDKPVGLLALADEIREESREAVAVLKKMGLKVVMMTGDNEPVARAVSRKLGLDDYRAGILPDQKLEQIRKYQSAGEFVAMTGDGINDAPALAAADVGIAVGSGTDVAADTADIILVNSNPTDISSLVRFGRRTHKKMIQNFLWATGYNVVAIPLAAGALVPAGIVISPALGALLMSLSTVIVAINARLLGGRSG